MDEGGEHHVLLIKPREDPPESLELLFWDNRLGVNGILAGVVVLVGDWCSTSIGRGA
jgi:hypothetical protein